VRVNQDVRLNNRVIDLRTPANQVPPYHRTTVPPCHLASLPPDHLTALPPHHLTSFSPYSLPCPGHLPHAARRVPALPPVPDLAGGCLENYL
jgi:hypothetical protein